jgi:uncharacterized protein YuzE
LSWKSGGRTKEVRLMKLKVDSEADALLLILREGTWDHNKDVGNGVSLAVDERGNLMAITVLNLSGHAGRPVLKHLSVDFAPAYEPIEIEADVELPRAAKKA